MISGIQSHAPCPPEQHKPVVPTANTPISSAPFAPNGSAATSSEMTMGLIALSQSLSQTLGRMVGFMQTFLGGSLPTQVSAANASEIPTVISGTEQTAQESKPSLVDIGKQAWSWLSDKAPNVVSYFTGIGQKIKDWIF